MGFVIAGLGNPGIAYATTRHNVGFMLVDHLAEKYDLSFSSTKWNALIARTTLWGERIYLVKPETFMNRCGPAIAAVVNYFDIPEKHILAVHDDLDMNVGRIKLVQGGGSGGHNGIRSMTQHLGSPAFYRLKIGIGRPGNSDAPVDMPVDKFVLASFSADESSLIKERIALLEEGVSQFVSGDPRQAMTTLNCLK